ncbi:MAG: phosphoribosylglycinamide formyltransferase [Gemmatimonadota bacterium]
MSLRLAVFASGGGSNLQALIDQFHREKDSPIRIVLVLSDRETAGALARARAAGLYTAVVPIEGRAADFVTRELLAALDGADVDLIALAGYLRLVPAPVIRRYRDRIFNIHPALLPAFGGRGMYGLRVQRAVLDSGCTVTGPTVHYVDEEYDRGPVIAQWPVPVLVGDTPETLAARVLAVEHMLYPAAIELVARAISRGAGVVPDRVSQSCFVQLAQAAPAEADVRSALERMRTTLHA